MNNKGDNLYDIVLLQSWEDETDLFYIIQKILNIFNFDLDLNK